MAEDKSTASFERLIEIGIALSTEKDIDRLMERILLEAKDLANADAGTLYIRTEEDALQFTIMRTDSLGIAQGGTTGVPITLPPVEMYGMGGEANMKNIASYSAITGETVIIGDAYDSDKFDFEGTKKFDQGTGYRSKSFMAVPLKNYQGEVIGVLQLINCLDSINEIIDFSESIQPLVEALASQAAVALENQNLIQAQKKLLDAFIQLMAGAVDAKSPYTGGHCQRVPELTFMLTQAACDSNESPFAGFDLDEDQWEELHIGAWLHDCGKVTTPEYVVDKATKLETITDRIHEVRMRFEVLKREAEIDYYKALLADSTKADELKQALEQRLAQIDDDYEFVARANVGGEFMDDSDQDRIRDIAQQTWTRTLDDRIGIAQEELKRKGKVPVMPTPAIEPLLADRLDHIIDHDSINYAADPENSYGFKVEVPEHKYNLGEIYNLCISRGTLTNEERFKINDHIVQTIVMLEALPFPKHLAKVPEIAGGHHEKMDGTGYPKRLDGNDMSFPARIMAIADVFEALTAADRPYKKAKTLSESIRIMSFMVKDQHLDRELFKLFLESGVYQQYAEQFLLETQIDEVNISDFLTAA